MIGCAISLSLVGCGGAAGNTNVGEERVYQGDYPIQVVCTTGQIADTVRQVGGEHIQVTALMGPGVDPHLYRALPKDINALKAADLIFYNGMHLEGRMADVFVRMARRRPTTFAVTEKLQADGDQRLREPPEFEGHYDPHVWHDAKLWSECVRYVAEQLAAFDPRNAASYQQNTDAFVAELATLHEETLEQIKTIPESRRVMVTAHDAFGYFGAAYGIEVYGLKGISTEDEVSLARTEEIVSMLVKRKIPAVFVESAVAPRIVEALIEPCKDQGHDVRIGGELYADALGPAGGDAATYIGMFRANVRTVVNALRGTSEVTN
jgi:manganese/zinc/iron transport system substrate-binding protein